jgi:hypothetical protein
VAKDDGSTFSPRLGSGAIGQIEGAAPTQEQAARALTELIVQSAESASLRNDVNVAEAQLKHATAEFESSRGEKYKNFPSIREQAQLNKNRAEDKVSKALEAASKHRTSYERVVQLLAGYITQGGRQDPAVAQVHARMEGLARDVSGLSSTVEKSDANRNNENKGRTAELEQLRTYVEQDIARMNEQVKDLRISLEGIRTRISKYETAQKAELSSHDTSITKLNISTATLSHKIDEFSKGLEARIDKAVQIRSKHTANRDETVTSTTEAVEAKIRVMLNNLESRLLGYENDRSQFATRDDINNIKTISDNIRANIQELQQSRTVAAPCTVGQSSEPYGVASFSFTPPVSTEVAQVNGNNQQAAPAGLAGDIAQLKAAVRSHRSRLDNMTTDQVVQAMLRQLEVLYPNAANIQQSFERLQEQHEQLRILATQLHSDVGNLEVGMSQIRNAVDGLVNAQQEQPSSEALRHLESSVQSVSGSLASVQIKYDEGFARVFKDLIMLQDRLVQAEVVVREQARTKN